MMAEHTSIVLRDRAAGRRAGLAGYRLDVWEVVETVQNEGRSVKAAVTYLGIAPGPVSAASHDATNVRVFGSVARGEAGPDSDVDFLVDLPAVRLYIEGSTTLASSMSSGRRLRISWAVRLTF
jgi:hypothetical protein